MTISGLPDMYTFSPRACVPQASGVHTYQANHECTWYNSYVPYSLPLVSWKQLKPGSMQVCKPIVFIGCWD